MKQNQIQIQINKEKLIEKRFFNNWCKALTDNLRVVMTHRRRSSKLQTKVLESLKLAVYLRKASNYASHWRNENIQRLFFNQVLSEIDRKTIQGEKVLQMRSVLDTRLKTRVMLGLKYYQVCMRGINLFTAKTEKQLIIKALDALRYYTMSQRVTRKYTEFRLHKMKSDMF